MTSVERDPFYIPSRIRNLYAVAATRAWAPNVSTQFSSILPETSFASQYTAIANISANTLMRDMGKTLTLLTSTGQHYATLRRVQTVNGAATEGVPNNWDTNGQYFVAVWTAAPLSIYNPTVARSG